MSMLTSDLWDGFRFVAINDPDRHRYDLFYGRPDPADYCGLRCCMMSSQRFHLAHRGLPLNFNSPCIKILRNLTFEEVSSYLGPMLARSREKRDYSSSNFRLGLMLARSRSGVGRVAYAKWESSHAEERDGDLTLIALWKLTTATAQERAPHLEAIAALLNHKSPRMRHTACDVLQKCSAEEQRVIRQFIRRNEDPSILRQVISSRWSIYQDISYRY